MSDEHQSGALLHNLVLFGRVLRGLGFEFGPGRAAEAAEALSLVGLGRRGDVHAALRALVVRHREHLALFDEAFEAFWRRPAEGVTSLDLRAMGERRRFRTPRFGTTPLLPPESSDSPAGEGVNDTLLRVTATYSDREILRRKDFSELTAAEREEVQRLLLRRSFAAGMRRSRRLQTGRGRRLDLRRTLRRSLRHGGEAFLLMRLENKPKPRPLVILADISGSMESYTRMMLFLAYALCGRARNVETFVFGTRLTRLTRELRGRSIEGALERAAKAVPDWSGGTRIGESLHAFNFAWSRRVRLGSAAVLLISDGWDRGDEDLLRRETARLQRSAHRLIWLNPLLGDAAYQPLARGMQAALPFVDDFLPVHNLKSLEDLAGRLQALDAGRPERRQVAARPAGTSALA